jgi:hypothetical protein
MADTAPRFRRFEATGATAVGIANQNIITNFRRASSGEVHLPSLRTLAKMVYGGHEFIDLYSFDLTDGGNQ